MKAALIVIASIATGLAYGLRTRPEVDPPRRALRPAARVRGRAPLPGDHLDTALGRKPKASRWRIVDKTGWSRAYVNPALYPGRGMWN
jgi:hypothetical protein